MGLRNFICLLPHEASGHGDDEEEEAVAAAAAAEEQPGTSYNNHVSQRERKVARVNCASGGAQMLACFRAGAINLIVHPAMAMGGQRQVQPVTSLPRTAFLDGHESGDDPTSPVVSCIGQVRKDKPVKTTPPKGGEIRCLKAKREKESTALSPKPFKWKQILGAGGTVNPSQQPRTTNETEFHIDLNRFGSSTMQEQAVTPGFGQMNNRARTFPASTFMTEPALIKPPVRPATQEVLLWKRRNGACKPVTLELKRRVLKSDFR